MKKVTVGIQGFSERATSILALFLSRRSKDTYVLVEGKGVLNILDLDCVNSKQLWEDYSSPEKTLSSIVVSVHQKDLANAVWLQKPLDVERLMEVIDKIITDYQRQQVDIDNKKAHEQAKKDHIEAARKALEQELEKKPRPKADLSEQRVYISPSLQGYNKDAANFDLEKNATNSFEHNRSLQWFYGTRHDASYIVDLDSPELFYNPNKHLQGAYMKALELARKTDTIIELSGGGVHLFLTDQGSKAYSKTKDSLLYQVSFIRTTTEQVFTAIPLANLNLFKRARSTLIEYSPACLLWTLSLRSSRGRLPEGISGDAVVSLKRWPNFTRLNKPPHAMKIAALWFNSPTTINATASQLNVPFCAVYSVFSACYALGLTEQLSNNEPKLENAVTKISLPKQFFRALFNKLS